MCSIIQAVTVHSPLVVESEECLVYGQNMERIPSPPIMTLDPNDHNLILEIPKDFDPKENKEQKVSSCKNDKV